MKISRNVQGKKYICFLITIFLIFTILLFKTISNQNKQNTEIVNTKINEILGQVQEQYPNINEEQIIKILNENSHSKKGTDFLQEYGISKNDASIIELEKQQQVNLIKNTVIIISSYIIFIIIFIIYLKFRQRKIDKLDTYIQRVSKKDYSFEIESYSEDELSCLKDSLYKITVMLKEEDSENKSKQNESILTSVSDISHQLKTPLTSIQILLDNITETPNMDETTKRKFILEISKQIKGMNFLILALLKLSRLDAGAVEFTSEKVDLEKLIEDVLSNLDILIDVKQLKIVKNIKSSPYITGDYSWNKEAILNIIKNAIEHTDSGKNVTITLDENNVYSYIKIKDEGEGIPENELKHIFDRFYKTQNTKENSMGIGLALAKSIIEKQNGYIQVESKINEGTTFIIKYLK